MAQFLKDVLYPGAYFVPDGKGGRRKVTFSREDVRRLGERMKEMLAAGLQIPLAAEHQDKAKPLTAEERKADWVKKLTLGWAEEAALAPEGFLSTKVEVPVAEEARRMPAVRFVSPEIVEDWVDGNGRKWPGPSITHLAVTPRPVQHRQKPFQPLQMSCLRLSLGDYAGEDDMADDTDKPDKPAESEPEPTGGKFDLEDLRKILKDDGYGVPDHVREPQPFLEHLHTAALSKKAMIDKLLEDEGDDDSMDTEGEEVNGNGVEPPAEPAPGDGPIVMSLAGHRFTITPRKAAGKPRKGPSGANKGKPQSDPRAARLEAALLGKERDTLKGRIGGLYRSGRVTKPIHDRLLRDASTVRLSLDEGGKLQGNTVLAKVEAYEELAEGSAWPSEGALPEGVRSVDPPAGAWGGPQEPAAVAQQVDAFFEMLPGRK